MLKTIHYFLIIITFSTFSVIQTNAQQDPLLGQINMFAGNFAPRGWAFCNGQLLPIANNTALFSIIGTTYGGDGITTFALPDLRGRVPMHQGHGPGLSNRPLGSTIGTETNIMTLQQMPSHNHVATTTATVEIAVSSEIGEESTPVNQYLASGNNFFIDTPTPNATLAGVTQSVNTIISNAGGGMPINNMQPSATISFIIALQGIYPTRN